MDVLALGFGIALLTSGLLVFPVRTLAIRFGIVDWPNERSSHQVVTPRAGGLAIALAFFVTVPWFVAPSVSFALSGLCIVAVAMVSLRDDIRSLSFAVRLVVQTVAAGILVVSLHLPVKALDLPGLTWSLPPWLGLPLAILFVVASCNFYNFMDGINGLAAGQGTLAGAALALLLWKGGAGQFAITAAALSGAAAGFLPHNFPRARVFMGDVGSVTLGFTLAVLSQAAHAMAGVPWTAILLVHAVFYFDACFTLIKRASRGESFWLPHREHNYQLLIRNDWSHTRTTLLLWLLSAESCLAGLFYAWASQDAVRWIALLFTNVSLIAFAVLAQRTLLVSRPAVVEQSVES